MLMHPIIMNIATVQPSFSKNMQPQKKKQLKFATGFIVCYWTRGIALNLGGGIPPAWTGMNPHCNYWG